MTMFYPNPCLMRCVIKGLHSRVDYQFVNWEVFTVQLLYSKTFVKQSLSKRPKMFFKNDYCLMQVKNIAECSKRAFCNNFDLH